MENTGVERVKSGIEGFDEVLKGGVPRRDIVLLTGSTGSGKTTLAMQFLAHGAKIGESGIYFTLEENPNDMVTWFSVFDPSIRSLIASGRLKVVSVPLTDYETFKSLVSAEIDAMSAQRVVIDSVTYLQMFFSDIMSIRKAIMELSTMLKSKEVATFIIGEIPYGENKLSSFGVEEFASDGVIALYLVEKQDTFIRALRVVKMRGTEHLTKFCPLEITPKGIVIYPNAELFTEMT